MELTTIALVAKTRVKLPLLPVVRVFRVTPLIVTVIVSPLGTEEVPEARMPLMVMVGVP